MRFRLRLAIVISVQTVIACSLITDYSLESKKAETTPTNEAGPVDEGGSPIDSGVEDVVSIVDADPGPQCTTKPCVVQIAAAVQNTCARLDDGVVKCWGSNSTGVVGAAQQNLNFPTPQTVALDGPADEIALGGWPQSDATACARRGGVVDCWGEDGTLHLLGRGALSTGGTFNPVPAPVANLTGATGGIAIGGLRACARVGDTLSCWGDDYTSNGQTGPVQNSATPFVSPKPVKQIAPGRSHHCAVYDSEEVACMGAGEWFNPEWNDASYGRGPASATLQTIGGVTGIAQLASLTNHVCALKKTGVVLCWGRNRRGELGRGTSTNVEETPAPVTLPHPAKYITAGANHTCALLDDDTVWCWGSNGLGNGNNKPLVPAGQIGAAADGGLDGKSALPREVKGLPAGAKRTLAAGYAHTCVLMADGSVWCFGKNDHGQLGLGGAPDAGSDNTAHAVPGKVAF